MWGLHVRGAGCRCRSGEREAGPGGWSHEDDRDSEVTRGFKMPAMVSVRSCPRGTA